MAYEQRAKREQVLQAATNRELQYSNPSAEINSSVFNCYFFNARSMCNKLSDLDYFLNISNPSAVGLCETLITADLPDQLLCGNNYNIVRKDRNSHGGGVALLVHRNYDTNEVLISSQFKNIEIVAADITVHKTKYRVVVFYRPPQYTSDDAEYMRLATYCFRSLMSRNSMRVIIMGDFNLPEVDWRFYSAPTNVIYDSLLGFVNEYGLTQFVTEPTRIDKSGCENILDLVFFQQ